MRRLKTHSQFRAVLAGPRIASTAHFVLHQRDLTNVGFSLGKQIVPNGEAEAPGPAVLQAAVMGAMVPKRWAKRAVTRNMIKRQIYTVANTAAPALPGAAYVVRLRATFDRQRFVSASSAALKHVVRQELTALFASPHHPRVAGARTPAPRP